LRSSDRSVRQPSGVATAGAVVAGCPTDDDVGAAAADVDGAESEGIEPATVVDEGCGDGVELGTVVVGSAWTVASVSTVATAATVVVAEPALSVTVGEAVDDEHAATDAATATQIGAWRQRRVDINRSAGSSGPGSDGW